MLRVSVQWAKALAVCVPCRLLGVSFKSEDLVKAPLRGAQSTAVLLIEVIVGLPAL